MTENSPDPVDVHVGARVRMRRLMLGLSQDKLAETVGLTFQQIQKYEKGSNRIGASRLFQLAGALNVPVQYFYEDLRKPSGLNKSADEVAALLTTPDGMRLCRYFSAIKDLHVRRKLLDLVKSLAEEGDDPVESRAQPQNGNKKKRPLH
ncbi:MAG: helix-turn-helix transcriptional regulator [Pseudomonadota bacterium]